MFARALLKAAALAGIVLVAWAFLARPSGAHGPRVTYRVQAHDTLWSIAAAHFEGDPGGAVWQIASLNHLSGAAIFPGETLILP